MQCNAAFGERFGKATEIELEILVIEEGRCTVDTAMGEVKRHSGHFEARAARHAESRMETASSIRLGNARIHQPTLASNLGVD